MCRISYIIGRWIIAGRFLNASLFFHHFKFSGFRRIPKSAVACVKYVQTRLPEKSTKAINFFKPNMLDILAKTGTFRFKIVCFSDRNSEGILIHEKFHCRLQNCWNTKEIRNFSFWIGYFLYHNLQRLFKVICFSDRNSDRILNPWRIPLSSAKFRSEEG